MRNHTRNRKNHISAKADTGVTEREHKDYLGLGFFSAVFLQLINCPKEGQARIRYRKESTLGERGMGRR